MESLSHPGLGVQKLFHGKVRQSSAFRDFHTYWQTSLQIQSTVHIKRKGSWLFPCHKNDKNNPQPYKKVESYRPEIRHIKPTHRLKTFDNWSDDIRPYNIYPYDIWVISPSHNKNFVIAVIFWKFSYIVFKFVSTPFFSRGTQAQHLTLSVYTQSWHTDSVALLECFSDLKS